MTTIHEFVRDLKTLAARRQGEVAQKLLNGGAADQPEYRQWVGYAKGVGDMADMAYELMKNRDLADADEQLPEMEDPEPAKKKGGRR